MKGSFSIKFYLQTPKSGTGKATVYIRIIVDRQKAELSTRIQVDPKNWDEQNQRVVKGKPANEQLDQIATEIRQIRNKFVFQHKPVSAKLIRDIYTGASLAQRSLLEYFQEHIDKLSALPSQEVAKGTVANYRATLGHLRTFVAQQKIKDILLEQVNYKFIADFEHYLLLSINPQNGKPIERNTVNKQHQRVKAVLNKAIREDLLAKNPYINFTFKFTKTSRNFLTDDELDKLQWHSLADNKSLLRVRDIYLFSVYTGLRFSDAMGLKTENIVREKDGSRWLQIVQEKTDEYLRIPILAPAGVLIDKYDNAERAITGRILPAITNQKLNAYLKTITELVGIEKELTHHTARHTFATTITLANDVPIEVVSRMLGHTSIKHTQIYAKITNQHLRKAADKLDIELKK